MRPKLTTEQRKKIVDQFRQIMSEAPEELQRSWNGIIEWNPITDYFIISPGIINKLPGELKDRFTALSNKVKQGSI